MKYFNNKKRFSASSKSVTAALFFLSIFYLLSIFSQPLNAAAKNVYKLEINGPIETITEEYIVSSFKKIKENQVPQAQLVIIEIDTPGGFSSSMRTIIKEIMASPVPVAVYVSPKAAQAASAGFFILLASDIACMSPGTNTGAAHPISITGSDLDSTLKDKVTNDAVSYARSLAKSRNRNEDLAGKAVSESKSYTADECLQNKLIEYIAEDIPNLLKQLDGKTIILLNKNSVTLNLKDAQVIPLPMNSRQKFLKTITDPNIALFLIILGVLGLFIELTHPGIIFPGVLGGISILLAVLAFQILPINYVGLLLILLSVGFFIAEIKITSFGILGIGGLVSFILGSLMLIDSPIPEMRPTMSFIIPVSLAFASIFIFLTYKVFQAMKTRTQTGQESFKGKIGIAKTDIKTNSGKVFIHGEWWNAISASGVTIPEGSNVRVESVDGLTLKVVSASVRTPIGG